MKYRIFHLSFVAKKTLQLAVCISFLLTVLLSFTGFANLTNECEQISEKVLRLHILANSDSKEDQALKLQVRDRILEQSAMLFTETQRKEEAIAQVMDKLPELKAIAQQEIWEQGFDYGVEVSLEKVSFHTREYDAITLPAGTYDALQIKIGEAKGKNWWCVLFPSLCVPSTSSVKMDDVLNPEEMDLVEHGKDYEIKFKVVEWYEEIRSWFG